MSQFYAYMWLREDGTPYYCGKGKENRAFDPKSHKVRPPKDKFRILIFERSSEQEAFETEKELIANWGRKDLKTGCLRNLTDGGEGGSGYVFTIQDRLKVSKAKMGHSVPEKTRQAVAAANKIYKHALGHKWEQVGTPEQLSDWGNKGHHVRWHVNRGIVNSQCRHCGAVQHG
jgi:hypothetical protein